MSETDSEDSDEERPERVPPYWGWLWGDRVQTGRKAAFVLFAIVIATGIALDFFGIDVTSIFSR